MDSDAIAETADTCTQPPDYRLPEWRGKADQLPLRHSVHGTAHEIADYYRKATWAPDGSCILATTESQHIDIFCTNTETNKTLDHIEKTNTHKSPSPLLDAIFYPLPADSSGETTKQAWCFVQSNRDLPIRLTNSIDMGNMASYSIMNHVERYVAPHSMAWSPDLSRLYCGLWSELAVFPLSQPGLNTHSSIPLTASKRSSCGQKGNVSALATAAHPTDNDLELVAVGTYFGSVGVYAFRPSTFPASNMDHTANARQNPLAKDLAQKSCLAGWREIEGEGITQLRFHPLTPYILFVASRKSSHICAYDLRYLFGGSSAWNFTPQSQPSSGVRSGALIARFSRPAGETHQRLTFDIDWAGRMLASGDEHGIIRIWNIQGSRFTDQDDSETETTDQDFDLESEIQWQAHDDAVGSVSFHPFRPWLLSVCGSRHWERLNDPGSSPESDDCVASNKLNWHTLDSSVTIWDFSDSGSLVTP